jgi:hypothetical protein
MKNNSINCGFTSLLQLAFIILKLCGSIDWPWIWVLSPTWIMFSLVLIIGLIYISLFFKR